MKNCDIWIVSCDLILFGLYWLLASNALCGFTIQYGQLPVFSSLFLLKLHPTCTARSSLRLETSKRSKVKHCWEDCWDMEVEMHPSSILIHMKPTSSRFPCLQNFFGFLLPRPPKDQTVLEVSWGFADSEIAFTKHQTICTENERWTARLASIDVNKSPGSTSLEWSDMCDLFLKFCIVLETCSFMSAVHEKRHESWWIQMSWCFMHVMIWMNGNLIQVHLALCQKKWTPRHPKCCEDGLHHLAFLSISVNFSEQKDIKDRWTSHLTPWQSNQSRMIQIHHGNTVFDVNGAYECSWEAGCPLTVHAARVWPAPLTQTIPVDRLSCGLSKPCLRGSKSFSPGSFSNINSLTTH